MKARDRIRLGVLMVGRLLRRAAPRPPGAGSGAPPAEAPGSSRLTVEAGALIDGGGGPARRRVRIEIRGGRIHSIEAAGGEPGARPGLPAPHLDLGGCTVIPGLIDSHVHLTMAGSADESLRGRLREEPFPTMRRLITEHLDAHLRHGVVAVRDGGGARGNALRFARSREGRRAAVAVYAAGRAWHRAGRYGRLIGRPPAKGVRLAEAVGSDADAPDHVKIVNSGLNSLSEFGRRSAPQFDAAEMAAAVRAAGGRPVMVHANGEAAVRIAAVSGCRSVEHGFFMGRDNLALLAERGIFWVPTAATMQAYAEIYRQAGRSADVALRNLDHQLEQLAAARELGVTVALGTDAGSPGVHHGAGVVAEMGLLMAAGFSCEEAVRCAGFNGARLVGADFGLIAPGRPATFVAVEGAPSGLPESLKRVRCVFIGGVRQLDRG